MRIALSIGHYISRTRAGALQYDPGAVNGSITEEEVVGRVGNLLSHALRKKKVDVVCIPRTHLRDRVDIINVFHRMKPIDVAMELHMNSFTNPSAAGTEVLHFPNSEIGMKCALLMSHEISEALSSRNRGARARRDLLFTRGTVPPAIMIEFDFLSNPTVLENIINGSIILPMLTGVLNGVEKIRDVI